MNQILDPSKMVKAVPFLPIMPPEMLRDLLAAFAMCGYLSNPETEAEINDVSRVSYLVADAMMKARSNED